MNLIDALQVEQLDRFLFRGFTPKPSLPRIFGGQVMAQAMNAAARTVAGPRDLHSFHSYFLRPGNPDQQIIFEVDPIRDGGSFTTRRVVAKQDGQAIYNCALSFMAEAEGYSHQDAMPDMPPPEQLESHSAFLDRIQQQYPDKPLRRLPLADWEVHRIHNIDPVNPQPLPASQGIWLRFKPEVSVADKLLNNTLLAYVSDFGLMATAMMPHGINLQNGNIQIASLDHAMWFHGPCNVNDWIYYQSDSHWSGNGRGLNIGKLYQRDGTLVASTVQEGLMRPITPKA